MKRKQITLPDDIDRLADEVVREEERTFSEVVRRALSLFLYIRKYRKLGWKFFRRKDKDGVEVNFVD